MSKFENKQPIDLAWEHSQHINKTFNELIPNKCSECFKIDKELREDALREDLEQAERSFYEKINE